MKQKAGPSRRDDRNTRLLVSHAAQRLPAFVDRPVRDGYSLKKLTQHFVLGYFRQVPAGLSSHQRRIWATRSQALKLTRMGDRLTGLSFYGRSGRRTACTIRKCLLTGFRPAKMSDRRLSGTLLPGQNLFGLSEQRNTEVVQLLRTLQLS